MRSNKKTMTPAVLQHTVLFYSNFSRYRETIQVKGKTTRGDYTLSVSKVLLACYIFIWNVGVRIFNKFFFNRLPIDTSDYNQ